MSDSEQDGNAGRMSIQEFVLGLMLLLGIGAAIGIRSGYLHAATPPKPCSVTLPPPMTDCWTEKQADGYVVICRQPKK